MKRKSIIFFIGILTSFLAVSCQFAKENEFDDAPIPENLDWKATTKLSVAPVAGKANFLAETNLITNVSTTLIDVAEYVVTIKSAKPLASIASIDFYVQLQEQNGYNFTAPFDVEGKLFKTVNAADIKEDGTFNLTFEAATMVQLFSGKTTIDRSASAVATGDVYTVYYVIKGVDGTEIDSRDNLGVNNAFTVATKTKWLDPIWAATFEYEWVEATSDALYWGRISIGQKGNITINSTDFLGEYVINDKFSFGYYYGSKKGTLKFNRTTGLVTVQGSYSEKWNITRIDNKTIKIDWEYKYSAPYNEYASVVLRRLDNYDWPTNIKTN